MTERSAGGRVAGGQIVQVSGTPQSSHSNRVRITLRSTLPALIVIYTAFPRIDHSSLTDKHFYHRSLDNMHILSPRRKVQPRRTHRQQHWRLRLHVQRRSLQFSSMGYLIQEFYILQPCGDMDQSLVPRRRHIHEP